MRSLSTGGKGGVMREILEPSKDNAEPMSMRDLQKEIHKNAVEHGWWTSPPEIGTLLALVHSEVSEALEDARHGDFRTRIEEDGKPCGFPSELADVVIRVMDISEHMGIDLEKEIITKHKYNKTRPYRHGDKKF